MGWCALGSFSIAEGCNGLPSKIWVVNWQAVQGGLSLLWSVIVAKGNLYRAFGDAEGSKYWRSRAEMARCNGCSIGLEVVQGSINWVLGTVMLRKKAGFDFLSKILVECPCIPEDSCY
ncbi:hypothetical protein BDV40DRAFT_273023 [Aspergillus tamarii]|uniref:Uncharacterized protein n=1 Tax=Aspergillus tamarii TaxID=41984 RepID=A0A5N6ULI3_ASPTM|nr:hypothetical protein BDV40DRAFT_273023 [Aspergillus tamarii]